MEELRTNVAVIMKQLEYIDKHLVSIKADELSPIKEHLKTLNGQAAKNTAHRNQQKVINAIAGAIALVLLGAMVKIVFTVFS